MAHIQCANQPNVLSSEWPANEQLINYHFTVYKMPIPFPVCYNSQTIYKWDQKLHCSTSKVLHYF